MAAESIAIVGAGPAGLSTARAYREHGGSGSVTLIGEERSLPYERPPLTKEFLRGELDADELAIEEERWFEEHGVELLRGCTVSAIDRRERTVSIEGRSPLHADAIVLATGAEPLRPDIPGMDDPSVLTMRNQGDSVALAQQVAGGDPALGREPALSRESVNGGESVVGGAPVLVLGMGFIGCEIAGSLAMSGAKATLIGREALPQIERLGEDAAKRIAAWLAELGVEVVGGATVSAVRCGRVVELDDGSALQGSCVVLGMGVSPRARLAEQAGLRTSEGRIVVDAAMRCQDAAGDVAEDRSRAPADVLAVGDVACAYNLSAGRRLRVEHWGDALGHGEVAGRTLAGGGAGWGEVPGFWSTIGSHTLKYGAWGDGYDDVRFVDHGDGAFTAWYAAEGIAVGVLTHERDEDYERGNELILRGEQAP